MENISNQEYRDELANKLTEIRNSDSDNPDLARAKAQGYLDAKKETHEYKESREDHLMQIQKRFNVQENEYAPTQEESFDEMKKRINEEYRKKEEEYSERCRGVLEGLSHVSIELGKYVSALIKIDENSGYFVTESIDSDRQFALSCKGNIRFTPVCYCCFANMKHIVESGRDKYSQQDRADHKKKIEDVAEIQVDSLNKVVEAAKKLGVSIIYVRHVDYIENSHELIEKIKVETGIEIKEIGKVSQGEENKINDFLADKDVRFNY